MICMGMSQVVISLQLDLFVAVTHSACKHNVVTIIAYFSGYFFTLKKGYTPETSVLIDTFDTLR